MKIIKCDICLREIDLNNKEDGYRSVEINKILKDLCIDCLAKFDVLQAHVRGLADTKFIEKYDVDAKTISLKEEAK